MEFSDKFTKSLAATLVLYKNAPIKLKDELVKAYLEERIENGVFICNALSEINNREKYSSYAAFGRIVPNGMNNSG